MKYKESFYNNLTITNNYKLTIPRISSSNLKGVELLIYMLIGIHFKKWHM